MKIIKLEAENVKRLKAITIEPTGNMVVIGGKNGHGKSSTLDSIMYALGGKRTLPEQPVRAGEEKAVIRLALDSDFVITRTLAHDGSSTLAVTTKTDARFSRPQELLDSFCARFTFDPLQFKTLQPRQQVELLREIAGIDLTEFEQGKKQTLAQKNNAQNYVKVLESELKSYQYHEDIAPEDLDDAFLLAAISQAEKKRSEYQRRAFRVETIDKDLKAAHDFIAELLQKIERTKDAITEKQAERRLLIDFLEQPDNKPIDTKAIEQQLQRCKEAQQKAAENDRFLECQRKLNRHTTELAAVNVALLSLEREKQDTLAAAKLPVDGLGFSADEGTITLNDIPFAQLSQAEQLRLSVAIGAALNPELKILLVRDGSLLDEDQLSLLANFAQEQDLQVWLERVGEGKECSVIIENGEIQQ